jgi:hypothetical protein
VPFNKGQGKFDSSFASNGTHAALIGALCGIAERSLAGMVGKRAQDFSASLGGNQNTAKQSTRSIDGENPMDGLGELGHEPLGHRVELFRVEQAEQAAEGDREHQGK